jgi:tRNA A37 N6-isopentenylltransferase MiaA
MTIAENAHKLVNGTHANGNHANGHDANGNGTTNGASKGDTKKTRQRSQLQPSLEVAISPNDPNKIPSTIESIQTLGNSFSATDDTVRRQLLAEARQLVQALETPRETMIKHCWAQVSIAFSSTESPLEVNHDSLPHTWPSPSASISVSSAP